ncbi:unnamed protein product [Caenorhabditis auriculariae]|uniref:Uncharacterized protein n=1 Tax=Caenorhabditis auriculariae TaxID=2777116 RepID=A0A8S1GR85_9PELO|nr:unnamed protein product [Caenorhabditis auriculariae]
MCDPIDHVIVSNIGVLAFDEIGDRPSIKRHMRLADIGKARSCAELKSDRRLLKTFQEENVLKMPSIDSDLGAAPMPAEIDELSLGLETLGKSLIYAAKNEPPNKSNAKESIVKKWLSKS